MNYYALALDAGRHVVLHAANCEIYRRLQSGVSPSFIGTWYGPFTDLYSGARFAASKDSLSSERLCDCCDPAQAFAAARRLSRANEDLRTTGGRVDE